MTPLREMKLKRWAEIVAVALAAAIAHDVLTHYLGETETYRHNATQLALAYAAGLWVWSKQKYLPRG